MPASINTLPSGPVSTAMLPPEPSSALMLPRSLCVTIGEVAALSLIRLTMPRASAKAWRGVSHPPAVAVAAPPMQHRQKPRRDRRCSFETVMAALALDEREKVGVDGFGLRGRHAVRETLIGLQRAVLQKLGRQWAGVGVGNDLIVLAVHHQHRHADLLQVRGEIGLRE